MSTYGTNAPTLPRKAQNRAPAVAETENPNSLPVLCHRLVPLEHRFSHHCIRVAALLLAGGLYVFSGLLQCSAGETNIVSFEYSEELKEQAVKGNANAQFWLAECYANGKGVAKDATEAVKWYRKAAEGGPPDVQYWVAGRFWSEVDVPGWPYPVPQDRKEALKWLLKSAERGHAPAQAMLGRAYEDRFQRGSDGLVPKDETEGVKWLRKAAEQGDSWAQKDLGMEYLRGTAEGEKWLRTYCDNQSHSPPPSAVVSGDSDPRLAQMDAVLSGESYRALASRYERGDGVRKDEAEAIKWYRKAAELGDWVAQWNVGRMLEEGKGIVANPAEAAKWYRKSAEQGRGQYQLLSQEALGKLYAEGRGVQLNGVEAIKWYRKAADAGSVAAFVGIAEVWGFGKGVPKDVSESVKWYKLAAEKGDTVSKFNLGVFYSKGEGVPLDYIEAYKWYNLAAANGYGKATELRNSLALRMTPDQIAVAQQRASEFVARKQPGNGVGRGKNSTPEDPSLASRKASGSGFFITEDGYLLTNAHVVDEAERLVVNTRFGAFSASLVKKDSVNDIAVLKVSGGFHALPIIPSRTVKLGDTVFTIGFPNPQLQGTDPKLTDGKISSLAGAQDDARQFQISAAVQPGNSGGALVNSSGNVVGIVAARLSDIAAFKTSGALPQNVNYAIKSSYVLSLLESLPEVANKLKEPCSARERNFEDVVKEAEDASALVIVY